LALQERAERTRAAILDAAAAVFDDRGYAGATLSDIIAVANVTKGAMYFHFSSKEKIAHAIVAEQFEVWEPLAGAKDIGVQTVIDLTHNMARSLQHDVRVRASIRLVIEQGTFTDPKPDSYQQWISVVRSCLEKAAAKGDLRPEVHPDDAAHLVIASFTGVQIASEVLTGREDVTDRVTIMWRLLLPGMVPPRRLAKFISEGTLPPDTTLN
jgi:AcrR family transcriptional regulator